jgi:LPPG:FO 2-phospho-L-lactate transferase
MKLTVLAGGVGAARFLSGLVLATDPASATVVVNTGDDLRLHGLHVSPDLDSITYTLGGGIDPQRGWGRSGDTRAVATELEERYGRPAWFALGDRDLATHLVRTEIMAAGGTLSDATRAIAAAWGVPLVLLPMTDDPVENRIHTFDGRDLHFQQWWVGEQAKPDVERVVLEGAATARPAPGVLEAIEACDAVLLCPSNPVVSIGTILQVPGIREALARRVVVGISPIVGGAPVRGMADRLLPAVGAEVSAVGVARHYGDLLDGWVIDAVDGELAPAVEALGTRVAVTDTIMRDEQASRRLARAALDLVHAVAG